MSSSKKVAAAYGAIGSIVLTACLLLLLLNGLAWFWLSQPEETNPIVRRHGDVIYDAYPGRSREQVDALLNQFFPKPSLLYEPYTQFKERPRNLEEVRVSGHGYRVHRPHGLWPIEDKYYNVFVFGGSTTFGYGVDMDDTIPARLQHHLAQARPDRPVRVYNFGRGYYMSVQERVLFETLLMHGHRPDLAIFIDGLNDVAHWRSGRGKAEPYFSGFFRLASNELGDPAMWKLDSPLQLYVRRKLKALSNSASASKPGPKAVAPVQLPSPVPVCGAGEAAEVAASDEVPTVMAASTPAKNKDPADDPHEWGRFLDLWFTNKHMIESLGAEFGVETLFVWQPHPGHRYRANEFHLLAEDFSGRGVVRPYDLFEQRVREQAPDPRLMVLSAVQQDQQRNLYVDQNHYTPFFNDLIASHIAGCAQWLDQKSAEEAGERGATALRLLSAVQRPSPSG